MTKIKLCGLTGVEEIKIANELQPEFVGFVFAEKSRRKISPTLAAELKKFLNPKIFAVGVFVNEKIETVAEISRRGIIDVIQLHGAEDENYISKLRTLTDKKIIRAFQIKSGDDFKLAEKFPSDFVLLDGGAGEGKSFDRTLLKNFRRKFFLAGGLNPENVAGEIAKFKPFAVDVSSGIETNGLKDEKKMRDFVNAVRGENFL